MHLECNNYMTLNKCPISKYPDGYCWHCSGVDHFCSVRTRSILYTQKLPIAVFLHLIWLFCSRVGVPNMSRILTVSYKCVQDIYTSIRRCMLEDIILNSVRRQIGGVGFIVEIDESKFGHRNTTRAGSTHCGKVDPRWLLKINW